MSEQLLGDAEQLDLEAIEARANAATPGGWQVRVEIHPFIHAGDRWEEKIIVLRDMDGHELNSEADADFLACVREDVPALLAEVRWLRDELEAEIAGQGVAERDADFANAMRNNDQLEARVRGLEAENAALRRQVGELCPVGDLDTITSLRAEIALLQEQVARYKRLYDGVYGMLCGESLHRTVAEFTSQPAWVREYLGVYSGEGATAEGALGLEEGSDG